MSELKLFSFIKDKILCFLSITVSFVIKTGCFEPSVSGGVTFLTTPLNLLMFILLFFCLFLVYQNPHERKTKQPLSRILEGRGRMNEKTRSEEHTSELQ